MHKIVHCKDKTYRICSGRTTLFLVLATILAETQILIAGLAAVFGTTTIALPVAAFVVSLKRRPYLVAVLLAAGGIIFLIPPITALGDFSIIVVPGPILGVVFGLVILGLGVAKSIAIARVQAAALRL